jgi:hypothetical protein
MDKFLIVLGALVVGFVIIGLVALISGVLVWLGWNHGLVPALGGRLQPIGIVTAWFLALLIGVIGNAFKPEKPSTK